MLSIGFNKSQPAIDGNINRIMFRYLGLKNQTNHNKKRVYSKLMTFINVRPGDVIQSLMDLGSSICKHSSVDCENVHFLALVKLF